MIEKNVCRITPAPVPFTYCFSLIVLTENQNMGIFWPYPVMSQHQLSQHIITLIITIEDNCNT